MIATCKVWFKFFIIIIILVQFVLLLIILCITILTWLDGYGTEINNLNNLVFSLRYEGEMLADKKY